MGRPLLLRCPAGPSGRAARLRRPACQVPQLGSGTRRIHPVAAQPWTAWADRAARPGFVTKARIATLVGPPLSVAQDARWYQSCLAPSQVSYNETISIRKDGPFDVGSFRRAFNEIVRRHEAWRT